MKARGRGVPRSLDRNGDKERLKDTLSGREGDRARGAPSFFFCQGVDGEREGADKSMGVVSER